MGEKKDDLVSQTGSVVSAVSKKNKTKKHQESWRAKKTSGLMVLKLSHTLTLDSRRTLRIPKPPVGWLTDTTAAPLPDQNTRTHAGRLFS